MTASDPDVSASQWAPSEAYLRIIALLEGTGDLRIRALRSNFLLGALQHPDLARHIIEKDASSRPSDEEIEYKLEHRRRTREALLHRLHCDTVELDIFLDIAVLGRFGPAAQAQAKYLLRLMEEFGEAQFRIRLIRRGDMYAGHGLNFTIWQPQLLEPVVTYDVPDLQVPGLTDAHTSDPVAVQRCVSLWLRLAQNQRLYTAEPGMVRAELRRLITTH